MKKILSVAIALSFAAVAAVAAQASDAPADKAKALFETKCSVCHPFAKPLGVNKDKAGWEATVKRMQAKKPGNFTDDEAKTIADYLASVRGAK